MGEQKTTGTVAPSPFGIDPAEIAKIVQSIELPNGMKRKPISLKDDIIQAKEYKVINYGDDENVKLFIMPQQRNGVYEITKRNVIEIGDAGYKVVEVGNFRGVKDKKGIVNPDYKAVLAEIIPDYVPLRNRDYKSSADELTRFLDGHPIGTKLVQEIVDGVSDMEDESIMMEKFLKTNNLLDKFNKFKKEELKRMEKEVEALEEVQ